MVLAVVVALVVVLVAVLHRRSGDVGAAADLATARAEIEARTVAGDDPFDAVERGLFSPVRRIDHQQLGAAAPDAVAAVELGAYADGTPALRIRSTGDLGELESSGAVQVELRSDPNGLIARWPANALGSGSDRSHADLLDLRSGRRYGDAAVELAGTSVIIALPEVFTPERSWNVTATLAPKQAPPPQG